MRTEVVEIYSDQANAAVIRHPSRKFPGVLVQGDTLHLSCQPVTRQEAFCNLIRMTNSTAYATTSGPCSITTVRYSASIKSRCPSAKRLVPNYPVKWTAANRRGVD